MKLTSAGLAFAHCYREVVEQKSESTVESLMQKGINIKPRNELQLKHDVQHVYEATVEVVDAVYWSTVLPGLDPKLKYPTAQK